MGQGDDKGGASPSETTVQVDESKLMVLADPRRPADVPAEPLRSLGNGDYILSDELGRGGMGQVILGTDRRLGRPVAVKRLLEPSPGREARFVREMLITARLQHPSIVPIYEAGRWEDGGLVYSMRKYDGRTLRQCIRDAPLQERLGYLSSLIAAAEAIAYAHTVGIVHRDLKPSNLVVGEFGETVVIDWGLAKAHGDSELTSSESDASSPLELDLTVAGSTLGTPGFISPEQERGEAVDGKSDVYSLGGCLYQLLTGKHPPIKRADSPPDPIEVEPNAPVELAAICVAAMADEAGDRPSAKELASELRRFQTGALVRLHTYSTWQLARRWIARHRLATAIACVSVVLLAVLGARLFIEFRKTERALADVVAQSDKLAVTSARGSAGEDPLEALRALSLIGESKVAWQRARVIAGRARRNGLPTAVALLPKDAMTLDLAGTTLAAEGSGRAWAIDVSTKEVSEHQLPAKARRIDTTHWAGWRGNEIVVLDIASGEQRVARTEGLRTEKFSSSRDGRLVATVDGGFGQVFRDGKRVFSAEKTVDIVLSPDGSRFVLVVGSIAEPGISVHVVDEERFIQRTSTMPSKLIDVSFIDENDVVFRFEAGLQVVWFANGNIHHGVCDREPRATKAGTDIACSRAGAVRVAPRVAEDWVGTKLTDIELARDRTIVAAATAEGLVHAWNYRASSASGLIHPSSVRAVAVPRDGSVLYSLAADGWVRRFELPALDAVTLGGGKSTKVNARDAPPSQAVRAISGLGPERAVALGRTAKGATAFFAPNHLGTNWVMAEDLSGVAPQRRVALRGALVRQLAVSDSGKWLAAATTTADEKPPREVQLIDVDAFEGVLEERFADEVTDLEFESNAAAFVVGTSGGDVFRVDIASRARTKILSSTRPVVSLAARDGQVAVAHEGTGVITWLVDGEPRELVGHRVAPTDLDFSTATSELVSISGELGIFIWDLERGTGRPVAHLVGAPRRIRIGPTGGTVAAFGETGVSLVDVATGEHRRPVTIEASAVLFEAGGRRVWSSEGFYAYPMLDDLPEDTDGLRKWISDRISAAPPPARDSD